MDNMETFMGQWEKLMKNPQFRDRFHLEGITYDKTENIWNINIKELKPEVPKYIDVTVTIEPLKSETQIEMDRLIESYKNRFNCLKGWDITYDETYSELETAINSYECIAVIGAYNPICNGEICSMEDYVKHEIFHIVFAYHRNCMRGDGAGVIEEQIVRDLTNNFVLFK